MIGITTLEVLEPKLYKWIYNHKDILCKKVEDKTFRNKAISVGYRERFYDEFKGINIDLDKSIQCISTMFPVFAKEVNEYQGVYQSNAESKKKMRICDEERFDIYFRHDLDSVEISRGIIKGCLVSFDKEELDTAIERINKNENIIYFLEEVKALIDEIPDKRINLIVSVILSSQWKFEDETTAGIFTRTAYDMAIDLVEMLLHRIKTEQERFELLYSILKKINRNQVGAIAIILGRIKLFYEENWELVDTKALISLEQLQKLEEIYILNIKLITETEVISNIVEFRFAFFLWEKLNKEETLEYFTKIARSDINMLKFICAFAIRWRGTGGKGWRFESSNYEQYISKDEIYNGIKKLNKNDLLEFTDIEKIKLATFTLNYQMNDIYPANEEKAQELVEQWEHNGIIAEN